ncbi:rhamnan synthesis F family protein [Roseomonas rosulenta]|uniref:rhamnan synthesis F family protein n=1 Tax=Roseomonas rosulenta TaxID=2748667 RepID=UPI0018E04CC8|nr:rhamnan synthesis F family protein [Roseomonas rosulenta]
MNGPGPTCIGERLHDIDAARSAVPRALHGLAVHSPWRYLLRAAQVSFELASTSLLDRLAPPRGGVTEVTQGRCVPRGTSIALYLHWSPSGRISAMVRRQLAIWRDCGFDVVFISNADPPPEDWDAVSEHAVLRVRRRNTGRDFGAWRDGAALALQHWPRPYELLLANDSVLGPFRPLQPIVAALRAGGEGLFGLTESRGGGVHLQSYVLLARGATPVASMLNHLAALRDSHSKWRTVQQGEIGMTRRMLREGHRCAAVFGYDAVCAAADEATRASLGPRFAVGKPWRYPLNPTHHLWRVLIQEMGFPYLKTELVRRNPGGLPGVADWPDLVTSADATMIRDHLAVYSTGSPRAASDLTESRKSFRDAERI